MRSSSASPQRFPTSSVLDAPSEGPLHVAILDEELPYPPTSGKRIRTLNLILRLAQRHRLTYLCHRNADLSEARAAETFFREHGIETVVVERTIPPKSGPAFYARLFGNLFSPLPYSVASHTSHPLQEAIRAHAARHRVDLWHCEWTPYAQALSCLPGVPHLVMAHNVESLIWQRYFEHETNPLKRWYIGQQWRKFVRFERRVLQRATRTVAVSIEDARLFRHDFQAPQVEVVDNGVDVDYFQPGGQLRHPARLIFLGSLDWRPNLDAVEQLFQQVLPAVWQQRPDVECLLVGRHPPEWLRRTVATLPRVSLHASVPDVRPFLNASTMLVVPLRIGGGSRLKILEALASGVPVVSTRVGAEGLNLEADTHLRVVATVQEMPAAILGDLENPVQREQLAQTGRQRVLEQYDWDILARRLEQIWIDCALRR